MLSSLQSKCSTTPELRNQPFAVGGGGERGVVATCNYLARQFGVRSAMPGHQARKLCPQLIFVKPNMAKYKAMSKRVYEILLRYTDLVEPASIDEFYLDLTANTAYQGSATRTLEAIRSELRSIGITASAGVSSQKMVAKIASEENKPDGQFVVPPRANSELFSGFADSANSWRWTKKPRAISGSWL